MIRRFHVKRLALRRSDRIRAWECLFPVAGPRLAPSRLRKGAPWARMVGLSQVAELTEGMTDPEHSSEPAFDISDEYRPEPPAPARPPAWYDGSVRIGIHTSIAGDIVESLEIARKLGCNALQIFSWSPRMWPRAGSIRIPEADATRFRERRGQLGLGPLVIHSNYLINL